MNDTHGQLGDGWIGFDLDGTLAKYDGWKGLDHIGDPVEPMVERIKKLHERGVKVKILTARVAPRMLGDTHASGCKCGHCEEAAAKGPYLQEQYIADLGDDGNTRKRTASEFIQNWCWKNLGFVPEITHEKNHLMLELYDDRVKQVVPNTGEIVEEQRDELVKVLDKSATVIDALNALVHQKDRELHTREVHVVHDTIDVRWVSRILLLLAGLALGASLVLCLGGWLTASSVGEKERKLHEAVYEYMEEVAHERANGYVERVFGAVAP